MAAQDRTDPRQRLRDEVRRLHLEHGKPSDRAIEDAVRAAFVERHKRRLVYAVTPSHSTINRMLRNPHRAQQSTVLAVVALWTDDVQRFRDLWVDAQADTSEAEPDPDSEEPGTDGSIGTAKTRRSLARELFLVRLTDDLERFAIPSPAFDLALSAAILSELVSAGAVAVAYGVRALDGSTYLTPYQSIVHSKLAESSGTERPDPLWRWLRALTEDAVSLVSQALADAGDIRMTTRRRFPGRTRVIYEPTELAEVDPPSLHLSRLLTGTDAVDSQSAMLAALVDVTGGYSCIPLPWKVQRMQDRIGALKQGLYEPHRLLVTAVREALYERSVEALGG